MDVAVSATTYEGFFTSPNRTAWSVGPIKQNRLRQIEPDHLPDSRFGRCAPFECPDENFEIATHAPTVFDGRVIRPFGCSLFYADGHVQDCLMPFAAPKVQWADQVPSLQANRIGHHSDVDTVD